MCQDFVKSALQDEIGSQVRCVFPYFFFTLDIFVRPMGYFAQQFVRWPINCYAIFRPNHRYARLIRHKNVLVFAIPDIN